MIDVCTLFFIAASFKTLKYEPNLGLVLKIIYSLLIPFESIQIVCNYKKENIFCFMYDLFFIAASFKTPKYEPNLTLFMKMFYFLLIPFETT